MRSIMDWHPGFEIAQAEHDVHQNAVAKACEVMVRYVAQPALAAQIAHEAYQAGSIYGVGHAAISLFA